MALSADHSPVHLFRAAWVIPVESDPIQNGAVAVQDSRIIEVAPFADLLKRYPASKEIDCPGVILPGLVNAHIHLELSVFGPVPQKRSHSTMCDWIRQLLQKRMSGKYSEQEIHHAAERCAKEQYASGVVLLLDIGNSSLPSMEGSVPRIYPLFELLGASAAASSEVLETLSALPADLAITGHAPYSTSPALLQAIKQRSRKQQSIFSLHVAENPDESKLLLQGNGCFKVFLEERGAWDGTFPLTQQNYRSVVDYLYQTHILDETTLCVHCVHVSDKDIELIGRTKSSVCLCPSSNSFLGVGKAPLTAFLEQGIVPALGTDSICSNPDLSLWKEMSDLHQDNPQVPTATILEMATIAGARAMGMETDYGTLAPGKVAHFISIEDEKIATAATKKEVLERLVSI